VTVLRSESVDVDVGIMTGANAAPFSIRAAYAAVVWIKRVQRYKRGIACEVWVASAHTESGIYIYIYIYIYLGYFLICNNI
jgi:hypothetical protein